jgi:hypothetical protein
MKLELKHLAPYLPYGLRVTECDNPMNARMCELLCKHYSYTRKPILRPMSDFDKMGLLGDDHYSYMSKLNKEVMGEWFVDRDLDFEIDSHNDTSYFPANTAYNLYEFLFEHHFDVFGLIPAGLAVDINTITS